MKLVLSLLVLSTLLLIYWVGFSVPDAVVSEVQLTTRVSQAQVVTPEYQ